MRCLYCGNELALLKRLTGGGEFCSEAHKKSYQEEYNRIALTRLLQAQARAARATPQATPSAVSVAIEEPVAEKSNEKPEEVHLEPGESGFLLEEPLISAPLETPPYGEPWQEVAPRPSAPAWLFSGTRNSDMPSAALLPLESRPRVRDNESTVQEADLTPNEFAAGSEKPPVPFSMVPRNTLEGAGPIALKIPPQVLSPGVQGNLGVRAGFHCEPQYRGSEFLGLFPSTIEFPAEDAEVTVISLAINTVEVVPADASLDEPADDPPENHHPSSDPLPVKPESEESVAETMPGAALEDLARTHLEEAGGNNVPVEIEAAPIVVEPEDPAPPILEPTPVEKPAAAREATPETNELSPRATTEFIEIAVKAFAPPKPSPIEGAAVTREKPALLPRLTGLPLRPKVALAPSQSAAPPAASTAKDGAREREGKQNAQASAASPAPPKAAMPPAPVPVQSVKPPNAPQITSAATAAKGTPPATPSKKIVQAVEAPPPKGPATKPVESSAKRAATKEPAAPQDAAPAPETAAPTFGTVQLPSPSIWGTLKVKLGIALLLVVVSCTAYLGWGTKSKVLPLTAPVAADAPGPSIMVGEGGWVEGWAGDPVGERFARQITIYRPSLKLADYRVEFQGQIDSNSIGWVFRAADPEDYYAMKLAQVSGGLSPKLALFKYLVSKGRQTQVGRVPIELTVGTDMLLKVRLDVRGPRFSTYVQGQQADVWTDDQLKTGGFGFLNEREERGRIKSVSIYYLNGGNK
ncbi:MAG: hypothetical protein ABSB86_05280 [Bryobacteraceae bacterium]|jgi:hypothetical protein